MAASTTTTCARPPVAADRACMARPPESATQQSHRRVTDFVPMSLAMVVLTAVMSLGPASNAFATSGYGNWGLVATDANGSDCLWVQAEYRLPGSSAQLDFNGWVYNEPKASCDHSSPWNSYASNEQDIVAYLWTSDWATFCDSTPYYIVPTGWSGGFGVGKGYNRSGSCATAPAFLLQAESAWFDTGNVTDSLVTFNY